MHAHKQFLLLCCCCSSVQNEPQVQVRVDLAAKSSQQYCLGVVTCFLATAMLLSYAICIEAVSI